MAAPIPTPRHDHSEARALGDASRIARGGLLHCTAGEGPPTTHAPKQLRAGVVTSGRYDWRPVDWTMEPHNIKDRKRAEEERAVRTSAIKE